MSDLTATLGTELVERLAFYGVKSNLINYLKRFGASNATAASVTTWVVGCFLLFSLLGGWVADALLGRYRTIFYALIVYMASSFVLTLSASLPGIRVRDGQNANSLQWTLLGCGLLLMGVGTGGVKANVLPFGADQFDDSREQDRKEKKSFFNWFYFFINVGALLAMSILVYLQDQGLWGLSFACIGGVLVVATLLFWAGRSLYNCTMPSESPLLLFIGTVMAAVRNRSRKTTYHHLPGSTTDGCPSGELTESKEHWLDWAAESNGCTRERIYEAKLVFRVMPIYMTSVIYWIGCSLDPLYLLQGSQMDRRLQIFGIRTKFPAASLSAFNTITLLIAIPVYDRILLPALQKYLNFFPTVLQRIGVGYITVAIAAIYAFCLERIRLRLYRDGQYHVIEEDEEEVEVVELSIFWLAVATSLCGLSEAAASIGLMEFCYSQAPDSMRSIMAAVGATAVAISQYLLAFILFVIHALTKSCGDQWITENVNHGHLDRVYLCISGMLVLQCLWFFYEARRYQYKEWTRVDADAEIQLIRKEDSSFPGEEETTAIPL